MASVPNQPTHNLQDDLSPGNSQQANTETSASNGRFGILNRTHSDGGTLPGYPQDGGTQRGGGGGQAD